MVSYPIKLHFKKEKPIKQEKCIFHCFYCHINIVVVSITAKDIHLIVCLSVSAPAYSSLEEQTVPYHSCCCMINAVIKLPLQCPVDMYKSCCNAHLITRAK